MEPERWQRIEEILAQALELPVSERRAFAGEAAGGDEELAREILALLEADGKAAIFFARPLIDPAGKPAAEVSDWVGRTVGPYRLIRKLGEGGMSAVYLAVREDDQYRRQVAVKVVRSAFAGEDQLRRFRTERQILASLEHPNIARLYDGGTTGEGLPYLVMEYVEGEPIDEYCDHHRLTVAERLEIFCTVCAAVHYAHQNLIVHRDLKPGNVLVTGGGVAKLLDFGIAKPLKPELTLVDPALTDAWQRLLTPEYASPEQIQGKPISTASDLYSLGVLLYKLLTGRLPHDLEEKSPREIERIVLEEEPERPSAAVLRQEAGAPAPEEVSRARRARPDQLRRQLGGDLDNVVLMALRQEPQRRYGSVERLDEDVRRHLAGLPVLAHPAAFGYRARKFLRRNRVAVAATAVFLFFIVGAAVLLALQSARIARERDQAQQERAKAQQVALFLQEVLKASVAARSGGREVTTRELLEQAVERIEKLGDEPETQATLMTSLGDIYSNLGLYDRAEALIRRALDIRRRSLGRDHPDVADSLRTLGNLRDRQGDSEAAEELYRESSSIQRRTRAKGYPAHGMTWSKSLHDPVRGIDHVSCSPPCNPYFGDTPCSALRPVLCFKAGGLPNPGIPVNYYHGWTGGHVAITGSVPGTALESREAADRICAGLFGAGWRMAEFHHPGGGWSWYAYGNVRTDRRFWVAIDDQTANCWDP